MSGSFSNHSEIGPSSAHRWMACPASVSMAAKALEQGAASAVKPASFAASEGTVAHDLCEQVLLGEVTDDELRSRIGTEVEMGPNRVVIDEEMVSSVLYYRTVVGLVTQGGELQVEKSFSMNWLFPGMFGTCDCLSIDREERRAVVIDFKYGRGHAVDARGNPQLRYYALAALGRDGMDIVDDVTMVIIQPRSPEGVPVSMDSMSSRELYMWAYTVLLPAARETRSPNPRFNPGEDQCRWCKGAGVCPSLYTRASDFVEEFFPSVVKEEDASPAIVLPHAEALDDSQVAKLLDVASILRPYFDIVEEEASHRALNGTAIPGYKLVRGRGTRVWKDPAAVAEAFGDKAYERVLLSPAKLEKVVDKNSVKVYTVTTKGKLKLAPESDRRPAVDVNTETAGSIEND